MAHVTLTDVHCKPEPKARQPVILSQQEREHSLPSLPSLPNPSKVFEPGGKINQADPCCPSHRETCPGWWWRWQCWTLERGLSVPCDFSPGWDPLGSTCFPLKSSSQKTKAMNSRQPTTPTQSNCLIASRERASLTLGPS